MTRTLPHKLNDLARIRHLLVAACGALLLVAACVGPGQTRGAAGGAASDSILGDRAVTRRGAATPLAVTDSARRQSRDSAAAMAAVRDTVTPRHLSPAADSIAPYLVFVPAEERNLVAAVRNKRWVLDVGRMDLDVRKDSARLRAFHEAAPALSPIPPRTVFRLQWAKGAEDVVVDSFAVYNGRIVARVLGSSALDSASRGTGTYAALAVRADSATPPVSTACELRAEPDSATLAALAAMTPAERRAYAASRKTADSSAAARVTFVRDSLETELRKDRPAFERLQRRTKAFTTQVRGCFGAARHALVVSLRAGDAEWVRERLVLIAPDGSVSALRVEDLRFRAHDLLTAFDADGDGVDDLAVRGTTQRAGGTAILRVDLGKKRADRLAAGFAWEVF